MRPITLTLAKVAAALEKAAPGAILAKTETPDDDRLTLKREAIHKALKFLRDDAALGFDFLIDLFGVDYLGYPEPQPERFEAVYLLYSLKNNYRLRLKVPAPEADPTLDSVADLYANADWLEREAWDMYGLSFCNHPDVAKHGAMRRILMYPEFQGHALRKDYPLKGHQPTVELRYPIETRPDPAYLWSGLQKQRTWGLSDDEQAPPAVEGLDD